MGHGETTPPPTISWAKRRIAWVWKRTRQKQRLRELLRSTTEDVTWCLQRLWRKGSVWPASITQKWNTHSCCRDECCDEDTAHWSSSTTSRMRDSSSDYWELWKQQNQPPLVSTHVKYCLGSFCGLSKLKWISSRLWRHILSCLTPEQGEICHLCGNFLAVGQNVPPQKTI